MKNGRCADVRRWDADPWLYKSAISSWINGFWVSTDAYYKNGATSAGQAFLHDLDYVRPRR